MTQTQTYNLNLVKEPIFIGFKETVENLKDNQLTLNMPTEDWSVLYGTLSNDSVYEYSSYTEFKLGSREYLLSWYNSLLQLIGTPLTDLSEDVQENPYIAEYQLDEHRLKPLYLLLPIITAPFTPISNLVCKQLFKELQTYSQTILQEGSEDFKETYYIFLEAFKEASLDRTSFTIFKEN